MNQFAKFRTSATVTSTVPASLFARIEEFAEDNNVSRSAVIRDSLLHHAHKAKSISAPPLVAPRDINAAIKPDSLRREYEAYANRYGISMSELVLRCLSAYTAQH